MGGTVHRGRHFRACAPDVPACIIACPYDVLGYNDNESGVYRPFHVAEFGWASTGEDCTHGEHAAGTLCRRACPRFRSWEEENDQCSFSVDHGSTDDEVYGVYEERVVLARATEQQRG